jgi:hypothetical protein
VNASTNREEYVKCNWAIAIIAWVDRSWLQMSPLISIRYSRLLLPMLLSTFEMRLLDATNNVKVS